MAERFNTETLENLYIELMTEDLAGVQTEELRLVRSNMKVLREVAEKVDTEGLFPKAGVVVSHESGFDDIQEIPLIWVGAEPENQNNHVYFDNKGELHLLHRWRGWRGAGDSPIDMTPLEKGVVPSEYYINFTKPAITALMNVVANANKTVTPTTP